MCFSKSLPLVLANVVIRVSSVDTIFPFKEGTPATIHFPWLRTEGWGSIQAPSCSSNEIGAYIWILSLASESIKWLNYTAISRPNTSISSRRWLHSTATTRNPRKCQTLQSIFRFECWIKFVDNSIIFYFSFDFFFGLNSVKALSSFIEAWR